MVYLEPLEEAQLVGSVPDGWRALQQRVAILDIISAELQVMRPGLYTDRQPCTHHSMLNALRTSLAARR